jgi:hypothetical protein
MNNKNLLGAGRKIARWAATLAVAVAMLAALSVAPADAQCRTRLGGRARRVYGQQVNQYATYPGYVSYQPRGYNNYGYYPGYSYDPSYDPYNNGPSKGGDVLAVGASVAGGALVGGMVGGKKGAIIGAAAGAALGAGIVVKRHRNYNNQYRYPYPF